MSADAENFGIDLGTTNSSTAWHDPRTIAREGYSGYRARSKTPSRSTRVFTEWCFRKSV
jgi:molecular chaperone DnaK (HSP70)